MVNKIVKAELNVISSTKGGSIAPHYDSGTKSLYLEQFNYEDAVVLQNSMYNKIYGNLSIYQEKYYP